MRSVNQNHHLYVVTAVGDPTGQNAAVGTTQVCATNDNPKDVYFKYKGHDGVTRSDLIPVNQVTYAKFVPASAQTTKLKQVKVGVGSEGLDDQGKLIVGQDYILNIAFQQFYGLSPEDTYVKTIPVHVTKKTNDPSVFVTEMIKALKASFSREVGADANNNPYLEFTSGTMTDPDNSNSTIACVVITEKEQDWSLGKWEAESLVFDVFGSTITNTGEEVEWAVVENGVSNTTVPNSKKMADLEWFTFGERGDFYRGMGYPNNFDFRGIVNPNSTNGYDALEIHFAYQGSCEDIQKSEKDITLIAEAGGLASMITAIQGHGITINGAPSNSNPNG